MIATVRHPADRRWSVSEAEVHSLDRMGRRGMVSQDLCRRLGHPHGVALEQYLQVRTRDRDRAATESRPCRACSLDTFGFSSRQTSLPAVPVVGLFYSAPARGVGRSRGYVCPQAAYRDARGDEAREVKHGFRRVCVALRPGASACGSAEKKPVPSTGIRGSRSCRRKTVVYGRHFLNPHLFPRRPSPLAATR